MITAQYNQPRNDVVVNFAAKARSFVEYHANDAPLLNQWHHLISKIKANSNIHQWITLVNPPFIPNDQYMQEIGLGNHYVRVIRLNRGQSESIKYIQQVVQNGKSAVVAVWADSDAELPDVLLNDSPLTCQALVFSRQQQSNTVGQIEMAF